MNTDENGNPIEEPLDEEVDNIDSNEEVEAPTDPEPPAPTEERFIDPDELPKELLPHFKKMQASFTRRMQSIAGDKEKINLYNQLVAGGPDAVKFLAQKAGLEVSEKGSKPVDDPEYGDSSTVSWIRKEIKAMLEESIGPLKDNTNKLKASQVERYLDENHTDWRLYDDVMADLVKKHPTLGEDVDSLYELAKTATTKVERMKTASNKRSSIVTKTSSSNRPISLPKRAETLEEAIAMARAKHGLK